MDGDGARGLQEVLRRREIRNEIRRDRLLRKAAPGRLALAGLGCVVLGLGEAALLLGVIYLVSAHIAHDHHESLRAVPAVWSARWIVGAGVVALCVLGTVLSWIPGALALRRFRQDPC